MTLVSMILYQEFHKDGHRRIPYWLHPLLNRDHDDNQLCHLSKSLKRTTVHMSSLYFPSNTQEPTAPNCAHHSPTSS
ncbi:hypothetical protein K443DRAFT_671365 [Laccaria amethystina LaAM-08-1]|uniref:Uncharacterized protein n=1 Tax=Laccaria amethystina LaAM-08-1 TaxID=1095629 RepID=A0A0C9XWS3_9AGAR|nr:hypothetical protein K443DRAFT_671365 [Laccaria amethystina LaAM-08-1]